MSAYRDLTDVIGLLEDAMRNGERFWRRHLRAPQSVITEAVLRINEDGFIAPDVADTLAPYCDYDAATLTRWIQELACSADLMSWQRSRIAIAVDDDLWADLGGVADSDLVSADVFRYLPYASPFIHFPQPILLATTSAEVTLRVVGAYIHGVRTHRTENGEEITASCATDDPRAQTISFSFPGLLTGTDGNVLRNRAEWDLSLEVPDVVWTNTVLRFPADVVPFGELAEQIINRFTKADIGESVLADASQAARLAVDLLRQALALTMYLCCSNADLEVRKATGKKSRRPRPGQSRPPVVVRAGFQIGAAIRAFRIEREKGTGGPPTGRTVKPHPRRAHFHRFRHGPGRTLLSQPRYLPMSWVNWKQRDTKVTTIKPTSG